MEKYADKLKELLMTEPTFTVEDKVNKNYVASLARQYDKKLLELLSRDEELANFFFVDINGSKIFKKDTFLAFINNKEFLPDSYTAFKSKIGLGTDADNYLSEDSRVVLTKRIRNATRYSLMRFLRQTRLTLFLTTKYSLTGSATTKMVSTISMN